MNSTAAKMKICALGRRLGFKTTIHNILDNKVLVTFISENFKGLEQSERVRLTNNAFQIHEPELSIKYKLIMEAFTPNEAINVFSTAENKS